MSDAVDRLRAFRGSRPARLLAALVLLAVGSYDLLTRTDPLGRAFAVVVLAVGLFALYRALAGGGLADAFSS